MAYGKEIITAGVTDWVTGLEKVYARQTKQLEEHHANQRERDKALAEKASKESLAKQLEGVAQFSSSVTKALESGKQAKLKKELEEKDEFLIEWKEKGFTEKEIEDSFNLYTQERDDILKGDKLTRDVINQLRKTDPSSSMANYLESLSSKQKIFAKELITKNQLTRMNPSDYIAHLRSDGTDGSFSEYQAKSAIDKDAAYKAWLLSELKPLELNTEFLKANVLQELNRKTSTHKNTNKAATLDLQRKSKDIAFQEQILARGKDGIPDSLASYVHEFHRGRVEYYTATPEEGITPTRSATAELKNKLENILYDGDMSLANLYDYFGYDPKHPAADNVLNAFFNEDQVKDLVAAGQAGVGKKIARHNLIIDQQVQALETKLITPGAMTQEEANSAIQDLALTLGPNDERIKKLTDIKVAFQTKDIALATLDEYTPNKIRNTSLEDILKIDNKAARDIIFKKKSNYLKLIN